MAGKFDGFWEMKEGGPYDGGEEVFKCTECHTTSEAGEDWNGRPNPHRCRPGCRNHEKAASDWRPGGVSQGYRDNYQEIFGHD